ncbi:MAG TPA: hypothetical protein VLD39_10595, partial [Gammaproteobacteria bacterium]|nr:hypothetical protein [Gammaproteobacteria bacterium]
MSSRVEPGQRRSLYRAAVSTAIFLLFIATAELFVGWTTILYPWRAIDNPWVIVAPSAMVMLTYVIRAIRLYRYFRMDTGFELCLRLILQHSLLVHTLPMRAGEFAFPVLMKRYFSMGPARTLPALAWLRLLDAHALGLIVILIAGNRLTTPVTATAVVAWMAVLLLVFVSGKKAHALLAN